MQGTELQDTNKQEVANKPHEPPHSKWQQLSAANNFWGKTGKHLPWFWEQRPAWSF